MTETDRLRPSSDDEIADSLASALRFEAGARIHHADNLMAHITAQRLIRHLERQGYVILKIDPGSDRD